MRYSDIIWIAGPDGNIQHLAEHDVTPEEAEQVLGDPIELTRSRSSGRPMAIGYTASGRKLVVVFERVDRVTIYPITAYEV